MKRERKLTVCVRQKELQRSYKNVSPAKKTHEVDRKTQVSSVTEMTWFG